MNDYDAPTTTDFLISAFEVQFDLVEALGDVRPVATYSLSIGLAAGLDVMQTELLYWDSDTGNWLPAPAILDDANHSVSFTYDRPTVFGLVLHGNGAEQSLYLPSITK